MRYRQCLMSIMPIAFTVGVLLSIWASRFNPILPAVLSSQEALPENRAPRADTVVQEKVINGWRLLDADPAEALRCFDEVIRLESQIAKAYRGRATLWRRQRKYDDAIVDLDTLIAIEPEHAGNYAMRAEVWERKGDFNRAKVDLDRALQLAPDCPDVLLQRAMLHWRMEDSEGAVNDINAAVEAVPHSARMHSNRSLILMGQGRHDEAILAAQKAIELEPGEASNHTALAGRLLEVGRYDQALIAFRNAARLAPSDPFPHTRLAWLLATCKEDGIRDGELALRHARRACQLTHWKKVQPLETIAAAHAELGEFSDAVRWQKRAMELAEEQRADSLHEHRQQALRMYETGRPYRDHRATWKD